jgi:hypothetical protein
MRKNYIAEYKKNSLSSKVIIGFYLQQALSHGQGSRGKRSSEKRASRPDAREPQADQGAFRQNESVLAILSN